MQTGLAIMYIPHMPDGSNTSARPRPPLYLAIDVDQLAAQAIAADRPELRQRPFAVVRQSAKSHKAAVFACSKTARDLGVELGMPVFAMRRKWRNRIATVGRDENMEQRLLERLSQVLLDYTPRFELDGRAHCLLDLTGTPAQRQMPWPQIAAAVAGSVQQRTGLLEVAVGLSQNRLIARVIARRARPCGVSICDPAEELGVLAATQLDHLPGLSSSCRHRARMYGIDRVGQLRPLRRAALVKRFGRDDGEKLYGLARGVDAGARAVPRQSVQAETVLDRDINDAEALQACARYTVDKLCHELRRRGMLARGIRLVLRYTDNRSAQASRILGCATDDFETLLAATTALFETAYRRRVAIRSMCVAVSRPGRGSGQIDLFEHNRQRQQGSLGRALTAIRERGGFGAVVSAANISMAH